MQPSSHVAHTKRTGLCREVGIARLPFSFWQQMIKTKSIYDASHPSDGERIYIDRLWPEGLSTRAAAVERWQQELAPSYELWRHVYDLEKWEDYRRSYVEELKAPDKKRYLDDLRQKAANGVLTLLFGTSDAHRNNAEILKEFLA